MCKKPVNITYFRPLSKRFHNKELTFFKGSGIIFKHNHHQNLQNIQNTYLDLPVRGRTYIWVGASTVWDHCGRKCTFVCWSALTQRDQVDPLYNSTEISSSVATINRKRSEIVKFPNYVLFWLDFPHYVIFPTMHCFDWISPTVHCFDWSSSLTESWFTVCTVKWPLGTSYATPSSTYTTKNTNTSLYKYKYKSYCGRWESHMQHHFPHLDILKYIFFPLSTLCCLLWSFDSIDKTVFTYGVSWIK